MTCKPKITYLINPMGKFSIFTLGLAVLGFVNALHFYLRFTLIGDAYALCTSSLLLRFCCWWCCLCSAQSTTLLSTLMTSIQSSMSRLNHICKLLFIRETNVFIYLHHLHIITDFVCVYQMRFKNQKNIKAVVLLQNLMKNSNVSLTSTKYLTGNGVV